MKIESRNSQGWFRTAFVVSIVLLLIAIAVPAYFNTYDSACEKAISGHVHQTYSIRKAIEETLRFGGKVPSSVDDLTIELPEMPTGSKVEIEDGGIIVIRLGDSCDEYRGKKIWLKPTTKEGNIFEWQCNTSIYSQPRCDYL